MATEKRKRGRPLKDRAGQRFGHWTVLAPTDDARRWVMRCDCGRVISQSVFNVEQGLSTQCAACGNRARRFDFMGQQSGDVTIGERRPIQDDLWNLGRKDYRPQWRASCQKCGFEWWVWQSRLQDTGVPPCPNCVPQLGRPVRGINGELANPPRDPKAPRKRKQKTTAAKAAAKVATVKKQRKVTATGRVARKPGAVLADALLGR